VKDFLIGKIIKLTKFSTTLGLIFSVENKSQAIRHSKIIGFHVVKFLVIFAPNLSVSKTIVMQLPMCSFSSFALFRPNLSILQNYCSAAFSGQFLSLSANFLPTFRRYETELSIV
jgi:hypothetical protein